MDDPAAPRPPPARAAPLADAPAAPSPLSLATVRAGPGQARAAALLLALSSALVLLLLPAADAPGLPVPAFVAINQTALVAAHGLGALLLFAQFRRDRSLPLLLAASGTLYTAGIVLLQMLSFPGLLAPGRLLGTGPETTIWLWSFWHVGPPLLALAYAATLRGGAPRLLPAGPGTLAGIGASLGAVALAGLAATRGLPWLPRQVTGDDYAALVTSGVGPGIQLLTLGALWWLWRATRGRRGVLDLWMATGLALLVLDNFVTMAGMARGTAGWQAGRVLATAAALTTLWAYLQGIDALRTRAEAATEETRRAELLLRQSQKMEAIGRLTGGIAHDFNNLLMVVSSGFEMIRRRPEDRARVLRHAEAGLEAATRGARLTRQLLTFARRQRLRPETMNPNALLLEVEPLLRRAAGDTATLRLHLDPALHPARLDAGEFEVALLNLVTNAREALPEGSGRIAIATRNARRHAPLGGVPAGDYVVVSVDDDGAGMAEAVRAQAFEPFFTTKTFGAATGLGLSQVHGFAHASGGTAEISSVPGRGTVVELWLPRADAAPLPAHPEGMAAPLRQATRGETVLVAEDEPAVLAAVAENLAELGYEVIEARDAEAALEVLRGGRRVDILFSDVVMPGGMNGLQLAVEAGRLRPGLRVLLTSGYAPEAAGAAQGKAPPILTKPYRREELAERLRAARPG